MKLGKGVKTSRWAAGTFILLWFTSSSWARPWIFSAAQLRGCLVGESGSRGEMADLRGDSMLLRGEPGAGAASAGTIYCTAVLYIRNS